MTSYSPKPGDVAILRVKVQAKSFQELSKIVVAKSGTLFHVLISDLEPDLTPAPPKPLEVGERVKPRVSGPNGRKGIVKYVDDIDEALVLVRFEGSVRPEFYHRDDLERVPQ